MRVLVLVLGCLLGAGLACANPALKGSWHGSIGGQALALTLDGQGGGQVDGRPLRYQVVGQTLVVEDRGEVAAYQFEIRGSQLLVVGGQLPGVVVLQRGALPATRPASPSAGDAAGNAAAASAGGIQAQLVGQWCKMSTLSVSGGGGSQSSACFELRADGSYVYGSERSMSAYSGGMYGGTSGNSSDAGRWTATANTITAQSNSGGTTTYRLEKRNHPKNRQDPMLCLDGTCYVTARQKAPW